MELIMTRIVDMSQKADSAVLPPIQTPKDFRKAVCSQFVKAVEIVNQGQQKFLYSLNEDAFLDVLAHYMPAHPDHNNPFNLVLTEKKGVVNAQFYGLQYRIPGTRINSWQQELSKDHCQGVFETVTDENGVTQEVLVDGMLNQPDLTRKFGRFAYLPETGKSELVDGQREEPGKRCVESGLFKYIPELKRMELVEGTKIENRGVERHSGTWVYDPKWSRMRFEGPKKVSQDGVGQQGASTSKPPLPTLVGRPLAPIAE
jgi:hypothetical protein